MRRMSRDALIRLLSIPPFQKQHAVAKNGVQTDWTWCDSVPIPASGIDVVRFGLPLCLRFKIFNFVCVSEPEPTESIV